ncbi:MAG: type II CAAX endopeptidase family protein [Planctomycetota bacterium]|nr:type II CAAX endopeptidase family protein [Planctomycetota bacterium]
MDPTYEPVVSRREQPVLPERCPYCGAPLMGQFYFCRVCATPYKDIETVISLPLPVYVSEGRLIEQKAPHTWTVFWTFATVVISTAFLSLVLFQERRPAMAILLTEAALFVTTCVFAARHWPSLAVQLRRLGFFHPAAWIGLAALAPLLAINYGYHHWLFRLAGEHILRDNPVESLGLPAAVVFFCALPAVLEEISFRGLIQHWLQAAIKPWRAMVLASALFVALHFSVPSAPYLFAVGMLLGWTKWKTGSLYPSILIHFLHNLIVIAWF